MYLILVVLLMLFCSTVTSYYWSQFELLQQTYTLYIEKQRTELALKALRNYGVAFLHENFDQVYARGLHKLHFKKWPQGRAYASKYGYRAELSFVALAGISPRVKTINLLGKLYTDSSRSNKSLEDTCALSMSYDKVLDKYTID